jgi:hypothetical protein
MRESKGGGVMAIMVAVQAGYDLSTAVGPEEELFKKKM